MPVIETQSLTKRYSGGLRGQDTLAVDAISFSVEQGQIFGFLGPNGSGKTTTIGMLLGIITPTGGGFRLFGGSSPTEIHAARQRIGATLEYPNFYPYLSCRDNLRLVGRVKGRDEGEVQSVLDTVGLASRQKTKFKACSLGMKQRLALAATMLGDPELIVLDEPANGLDPAGQREIREIIHRLSDMGKTIFLSSHLLHEVERTCTHVAIIEKGRLIRQASVGEITERGTVVGLRAEVDEAALVAAVGEFPGATGVRTIEGRVIAQLENDDPAELNRFLAGRGIHLAHLAEERLTLEEAFMELTGGETGFGDVH
ncbi:MAG: ABC transporter ATP-binding protein [Gemmatimonadota bacterium]|nr:ABC transporter ATP-binding protein [Gemmatimonadota bacterium]